MRARSILLLAGGVFVLTGTAWAAPSPVAPSSGAGSVRVEPSAQFAPAAGQGLPFDLDAAAPSDAAQADSGNEWVVAPVPFVNPLVGTGLAGGVAYIYHPPGEDKKLPPWTTGVGGFYSDSKSWALAVAHKMNLRQDSWRLTGMAGYGQLNYDFYGIGAAAGSDGRLVALEQTVAGVNLEGLYEVREHLYTGLCYVLSKVETQYGGDNLPPWINEIASQGQLSAMLSIPSLRMQWDSRDNTFLPTQGWLVDGEAAFSDEKFGSEFTYQALSLVARHYWAMSERTTLAVYGFGRFAFGDVPFYALSMIGAKGNLRGYPVGRYQDNMAITGQVEYRWQLWRRLGVVAFAGVGAVAPDLQGLTSTTTLPSIGGGLRYLLTEKNKVNFRLDVAWGRDEMLCYVSVGEAF